jgi:hypothetical protein
MPEVESKVVPCTACPQCGADLRIEWDERRAAILAWRNLSSLLRSLARWMRE